MVSWSLFLLLGVLVLTASHFVLSCAPTHRAYDVVVQLSLTSAFGLSYLCHSTFVHRYGLLEVERLDQLKASKMKEIAFKKQIELEDIYSPYLRIEIEILIGVKKIICKKFIFVDQAVLLIQKRFHEQLATEQEAMFGSRPSPVRPLGAKKVISPRSNGSAPNGTATRRLSLNSHQSGSSGPQSVSRDGKRDNSNRPAAPVNYVAIAKEDAASPVQVNASP
ncbi:hypothetical protein BHM03_00023872 [Ensete ventricosum]|nr:hypothetical protein BHM03_00023872 [Ensete ventricosum]